MTNSPANSESTTNTTNLEGNTMNIDTTNLASQIESRVFDSPQPIKVEGDTDFVCVAADYTYYGHWFTPEDRRQARAWLATEHGKTGRGQLSASDKMLWHDAGRPVVELAPATPAASETVAVVVLDGNKVNVSKDAYDRARGSKYGRAGSIRLEAALKAAVASGIDLTDGKHSAEVSDVRTGDEHAVTVWSLEGDLVVKDVVTTTAHDKELAQAEADRERAAQIEADNARLRAELEAAKSDESAPTDTESVEKPKPAPRRKAATAAK